MQDSSNATHEEVRNAMGRARRPSHSILPRSRAEQSLRASLDPARTYLQGGGYDSRQCRADTQLAMIGVSMRVTPNPIVSPWRNGVTSMAITKRTSPSVTQVGTSQTSSPRGFFTKIDANEGLPGAQSAACSSPRSRFEPAVCTPGGPVARHPQPRGRKPALRPKIPSILRGFQERLSC